MDKKILGSSAVMNLLIPHPAIDLENDTQPLPNKNPIQIRTMFDFVDKDVIYLEEFWDNTYRIPGHKAKKIHRTNEKAV